MTHPAKEVVESVYAAVDRADADGVLSTLTDDVEIADEVTRGWNRGLAGVSQQVRSEISQIPGISSEVRDFSVRELGDVAVVSYAVSQRFERDGGPVHLDGPAVAVLRRDRSSWRICLMQSTPYPVAD